MISPVVSGYCRSAPKNSPSYPSRATWPESISTTEIPNGFARVITTAFVCGCTCSSIRKTASSLILEERRARVIASAAAVDSSSIDAFEISRPVSSQTIVWKAKRASKRPCEISGWYGVYAVYQAGFSKTFRLITGGTIVP